ncbi:phosphate ABC transporter substrate-binding protein [Natronospora cellulosivora (SeqCode)]
MIKTKLIVFSLVMVLVFSGLIMADDSLVIQGSSTVLPIAQAAAEAYMEANPGVNISVRGGGSGNGIAAVVDNACDIGNASRFIRQSEVENAVANGGYPVPHRVAMDGIAVVLHPSNPIDGLSLDDIQAIFTGQITNWNELGGSDQRIVIVSRDSSSGTYGVFNDLVLRGERLSPAALLQASNGAVAGVVADTRGAIGYVGFGYLSDSLKAIDVEGVTPTATNVVNGSYPIARGLFMFTNGWPEGLTADFITFILSREGQDLSESVGYVPLF